VCRGAGGEQVLGWVLLGTGGGRIFTKNRSCFVWVGGGWSWGECLGGGVWGGYGLGRVGGGRVGGWFYRLVVAWTNPRGTRRIVSFVNDVSES